MDIDLSRREKRLLVIIGAFFFLTVVAPGFGLQYADGYAREQENLKGSLEQEIVDIRERLAGIEDEREQVRANRANYIRWVESGVVGEQDPVRWVRAAQKVQDDRGLFPLAYDFESEALQPPSLSPFTAESSVQMRLWELNVQMPMLHDLDFLMFIQSMGEEWDGFMFPVDCSFNLVQSEFALEKRPNMDSQCKFVWVSAHDPETRIAGPESEQ